MGQVINGYELISDFSTNNAGMCQWAFAKKDGHEYFIKQLLYPKYPLDGSTLSDTLVADMRKEADNFFKKRSAFFKKLAACRNGNIIIVQDFFREETLYYVVTERISGSRLSMTQVASLPEDYKRILTKVLLHCAERLEQQGIIHSDLKPDNIIFTETVPGFYTAKLIDFDSSYTSDDVPEEIEGDQVYFSPEALLRNIEEEAEITPKSDMFSLGLILHQIWAGCLPDFNKDEYYYASNALLEGQELYISDSLPPDITYLISQMLQCSPDNRISAKDAFGYVCPAEKTEQIPNTKPHVRQHTGDTGAFRPPMDDDL